MKCSKLYLLLSDATNDSNIASLISQEQVVSTGELNAGINDNGILMAETLPSQQCSTQTFDQLTDNNVVTEQNISGTITSTPATEYQNTSNMVTIQRNYS